MKKPNIWISWVFGVIFSIVSIAIYTGTAFLPEWPGFILRLISIVLISGIPVGCIFHIMRKLKWIEEDEPEEEDEV